MSSEIALKAHSKASYREQRLRKAVEDAVGKAVAWSVIRPRMDDSPGDVVKRFPDELREKLRETKPRHYDDMLRAPFMEE